MVEQLKFRVSKMDSVNQDKIHITDPSTLYTLLQTKTPKQNSQQTIKGYRVKVEYKELSTDNIETTRDSLNRNIVNVLKKKANKKV